MIMRAYILLSGGLDSMAAINFYIDLGYDVKGIFCDYGQPSRVQEYKSAKRISDYFNIDLQYLHLPDLDIDGGGEIIGRNALLVLQVLAKIKSDCYKIVLGIHSGTSYVDCSEIFVEKINDVIDLYSGGKIICEAPFIKWIKPEIIGYIMLKSLPYHLTYSCEYGLDPPCGRCSSCLDRKEWLNE